MTTLNLPKLDNLVLHIIRRVGDPARLGAVKLQKIVWFSDGEMILRTGAPISGADFRRRPRGPHSRDIEMALSRLKAEGRIAERKEASWGDYEQRLFFASAKPDLSHFSAEEIAIVDEVIDETAYEHTARSISEVTHDRLWHALADGDEFQPSAVLAWNLGTPPDAEDVAWAAGCGDDPGIVDAARKGPESGVSDDCLRSDRPAVRPIVGGVRSGLQGRGRTI